MLLQLSIALQLLYASNYKMKKSLFFFILTLFIKVGYTQTKNPITLGRIDTIKSKILQENRALLIYTPATASKDRHSNTGYPVMYLLDGEAFFNSFTGMVQYLSSIGKMPEMIIVGIKNTDRNKDLTPTHWVYWSDGEKDEKALHNTGGGEKFLSFIQNELIPHIESTFPTAPYRMFVGHSLGGLTVLNAFANHSSLFKSYVAIDPTVWWDNRLILRQTKEALAKGNYEDKSLFYASANTMDKNMDTIRVMNDTAQANIHVKDNLLFRGLLQQDKTSRLNWQWKYYPEDNHPSVPFISAYDALRVLFKGYDMGKEMDDPSLTAEYVQSHYQDVSKLLGYELKPEERILNIIGYLHLSEKRYQKAYGFFKMNIDNYPQSFNVYDSMGDYYLAIGDKKNARSVLSKALQIKDNPDTRKKLQELQPGK
jgi:predicted alpha/beta superfamily hydrolase